MRRSRNRSRPRGFTLFEQAVVVAGIGVASADALPQFAALQVQAEHTLRVSLASAAGSAMRLNQAGCAVSGQRVMPGKCQPIRDCAQVLDLLQSPLPPGYQVQAEPPGGDTRRDEAGALACAVAREADGARAAFAGRVAGRVAGD